jgi:NhaP-type Na+/H+ and K+/H+ antiporter
VQEVLAVAFEMVTLMVVLFAQLAGTPAEVLLSPVWLLGFSVGAAVAGLDSSAIGEVGAACLVESVMLTIGAESVGAEPVGAEPVEAASVGAALVGAVSVGAELGSSVAVAVGLGSAAPCLTGTMFCIKDRSA